MLKQLRLKFVAAILVIVTAMLCVIFGLVYHFTSQSLEAESIQMMQDIAADPFQLGTPKETASGVRLPYFSLVTGPRGELIATGGGYYDLSDEDFLRELLNVAFYSDEQVGTLKDYNLRFCRVTASQYQCIVFADMSSEQTTLHNLVKTCLLIGGVSLLAFLAISLLLARWTVKPVEQAWEQQRQFVADASHELKTPLTVILTNAELLQAPDCDEATRSQCSGSILTMSRQMRGLVERLLELARVDSGVARLDLAPLDLSELISDALLPFEPLYFEAGLTLESQIDEGIAVKGSEAQLRQAADILLDNALKYSTPGGTVAVTLTRQGGHSLLAVASPGEAISDADLKNIFKRFYRVDKARRMDHSYGLGLSIAEQIVHTHRGRIWAESAGGQNTFFVQLPALPPAAKNI